MRGKNSQIVKWQKNFVQYTYEVWRDIAACGKFSFLAIIPQHASRIGCSRTKVLLLLCRREMFFFDPFGIMPSWITETVRITLTQPVVVVVFFLFSQSTFLRSLSFYKDNKNKIMEIHTQHTTRTAHTEQIEHWWNKNKNKFMMRLKLKSAFKNLVSPQ